MIKFDHIAITVENLEKAIAFYKILGYQVQSQFNDLDYNWTTLTLGDSSLEIFEMKGENAQKIEHMAFSFTEDREVLNIATKLGYSSEELEFFYGDLKRKSLFIEDDEGRSIQFIKK